MYARLWSAAAVLIALAGCGSQSPSANTPATENTPVLPGDAEDAEGAEGAEAGADDASELAPPPFTVAQIRDATKAGRTYRFAMNQGEQKLTVTMRFTAVTAEGATIERSVVDEGGNTLDQGTEEATWEQLVDHASYPADATVITKTKVTVPAGEFDALLYTITTEQDGKPVVSRMYFVESLPGAPIKAEVTIADQPMFTMELLAHESGE